MNSQILLQSLNLSEKEKTNEAKSITKKKYHFDIGHPVASILCLFLTLPNVVFGLEIKQKLYHVAAEPQSSAVLSCQADSIPEKCSFTT